MKASKPKKAASWSDVKARLTQFDRDGLVGLLQPWMVDRMLSKLANAAGKSDKG